jgi:hypothetical protein
VGTKTQDARAATPMTPTAPNARPTAAHLCCGRRLRRVDIDASGSAVTFTYCGKCENVQWFSDGTPVSRADLVPLVRAIPVSRRRAG